MTTKTTDQTTLPPLPDPRAMNGVRHGILSELVPAWEREGYAAHARAIRESVGATDYLQERLADRAALALWRLDRVARWEAAELEADHRRFHDRLRSKVVTFGLPDVESAPVDALSLRDSLAALARMTGETEAALVRDLETVELVAADRDREAQAWEAMREGDLERLTTDQVEVVGVPLLADLQNEWDADPARLARLMCGGKASKQDAQAVADWDWTVEPQELPPLVAEAVRLAGSEAWSAWLLRQQLKASREAQQLRAVLARLPDLMRQELLQATEPDTKRLEKVARYEAHLERVLYRALRELQAMKDADQPDLADPAQSSLAAAATIQPDRWPDTPQ
ncbi:hypothetical protein F8S09_17445 [Deinococcus sp. SDU3-2]|uniref:Uncharacterized protein n=1 Tax=Deinococcus terrestris TaxID=2651870 RepID=A0A7X1NZ25_9DEIO|nr:hypothetical protein [Deinococcus terrestris]MPY68438.1 hypothetical protein [Deinococcus terrestris]